MALVPATLPARGAPEPVLVAASGPGGPAAPYELAGQQGRLEREGRGLPLPLTDPGDLDQFLHQAVEGQMQSRLHGWPIPSDPVRRREDELAREAWGRLRQALGGP